MIRPAIGVIGSTFEALRSNGRVGTPAMRAESMMTSTVKRVFGSSRDRADPGLVRGAPADARGRQSGDSARDEAGPSRAHDRHDADPPTRTTELGAPRPSSGASGAVGSATHWEVPFAPLTTNAYTCRPAGSFKRRSTCPPVEVRVIGVACASQSLKSPTTETVPACGAMRTNLMTRTSEEGERGLLIQQRRLALRSDSDRPDR